LKETYESLERGQVEADDATSETDKDQAAAPEPESFLTSRERPDGEPHRDDAAHDRRGNDQNKIELKTT